MDAVRGISLVLALGVLAGCAADSPLVRSRCPTAPAGPYPTRYLASSEAEHDARVNAFRAKNPGDWSTLTLGVAGLVDQLVAKGAPLVDDVSTTNATSAERSAWIAFVKKNAESFGAVACNVALAHRSGSSTWAIVLLAGTDAYGAITFEKKISDGAMIAVVRGHIVQSTRIPQRRISDEVASAPLFGHKYGIHVAADNHPVGEHVDCDGPASMLANKCPFTTTVEASSENVDVSERVACVQREGALEVRRVLLVGLGQATMGVHRTSIAKTTMTPLDEGPKVPRVVDAVTGDDLSAAAIDDCGQTDL